MLTSCFSMKPGSKSKASKYFATFYVDAGVNQYFIKPIEYDGKQNGFFSFDISFRDKLIKDVGADLRFSYMSESPAPVIDSITFVNESGRIVIINIEKIFFEKKGDNFHFRGLSNIASEQFTSIFNEEGLKVLVYHEGKIEEFDSDSDSRDAFNYIKSELLSILKLQKYVD